MTMTHKKNRRTRNTPVNGVNVYINGEFYKNIPCGQYALWRAAKEIEGFNGHIEASATN